MVRKIIILPQRGTELLTANKVRRSMNEKNGCATKPVLVSERCRATINKVRRGMKENKMVHKIIFFASEGYRATYC